MKVCFIGEFPLPNSCPEAGPENVLYNLVKSTLNYPKIKITIVTIRNDVDAPFSIEYFPNVYVYYLPRLKVLPRSFGDPIIIKKYINNFDFNLIHAHYPIVLLKIMNLKIPIVLTLHGIFHIEKRFVRKSISNILYYNYNMYALKKILPKLDGFVAISPYVIDILRELNMYDKMNSVFQINNPIDEIFFSTLLKTENNNIIYYPARITERKNQLVAIETIKLIKEKIPNIKLILTGGYEKTYLEKLNNSIVKNDLINNVEYLGKVSRDQILELYQKASIVYLLSNQETQPMSIMEAMATGTPVIASNIDSNKYLIENGINGYLLDQKNPEKIAECTIKLLGNQQKRIELSINAKKIAQERYHSDIITKQTMGMYKNILEDKR